MTIDEMIAVLSAYRKGRQVQVRIHEAWIDEPNPSWDFPHVNYRIKPEPHYRPFKNAEEVMEAIKEHGDWLVFHDPNGDYYHHISAVFPERKDLGNPLRIRFNGGTHAILQTDCVFYTFADGVPFGKLEE